MFFTLVFLVDLDIFFNLSKEFSIQNVSSSFFAKILAIFISFDSTQDDKDSVQEDTCVVWNRLYNLLFRF